MDRAAALRAMTEASQLDVLVIGGGVVGAGSALDAVTRGLSTGIVEARDWASGTSSRSSKLIHGGLRYLEMLDFALVREALQERSLLLGTLAPHLVRPVSFLYPLRHRVWERAYVGAGVALYDTMGFSSGMTRGLPRHRHLSRRAALRLSPALRRDALTGAVRYYDAQVDDARLTMLLVRTAVSYGAHALSRAQVVGFLREGGRVVGVEIVDQEDGRHHRVRANQVINATGVWTDETQAMVGERGTIHVRASKGVHLVVPRDRIHSGTGVILRTATSVLFVIPWGRHWIIGTTDTPWELSRADPVASRHDVDYLLGQVNQVLARPLAEEDVQGVYAGLRPLLSGESDLTSKLSREHTVASATPGLVTVAGGKYTTYRVMARDAVDAAAHGLDRSVPPSCTAHIPLLGADGFPALWNQRQAMASRTGLHVARIEHLLGRYGSLVHEILALVREDPSLGEPLPGADDYLRVEVAYAASHEGALHLDDVLLRRTHIGIETPDRGTAAASAAALIMAARLGWDSQRVSREVDAYQEHVAAERAAQKQSSDEAAETALGVGAS
jgi:glycerol-3-phosphate dehydrogenase